MLSLYLSLIVFQLGSLYYRLWYSIKFIIRSGVENTRLEAKAKDTKKIRGQGQGQPFRRQAPSRPRTGMLEAKAKDQGHRRKCSPKKIFFSGDFKKKVFKKIFASARVT